MIYENSYYYNPRNRDYHHDQPNPNNDFVEQQRRYHYDNVYYHPLPTKEWVDDQWQQPRPRPPSRYTGPGTRPW
uniref:Uncharacterized protein n=1 Tax=Panagrolaimus davidi TaxID=227884 RepID=A0A914QMP9_9BILA